MCAPNIFDSLRLCSPDDPTTPHRAPDKPPTTLKKTPSTPEDPPKTPITPAKPHDPHDSNDRRFSKKKFQKKNFKKSFRKKFSKKKKKIRKKCFQKNFEKNFEFWDFFTCRSWLITYFQRSYGSESLTRL